MKRFGKIWERDIDEPCQKRWKIVGRQDKANVNDHEVIDIEIVQDLVIPVSSYQRFPMCVCI